MAPILSKHSFLTLLLGGFLVLGALPAWAQLTGLGGSDENVIIEADKGIQWLQEEAVYIATGNAVAQKGAFSVTADVLRAYYNKDGQTKDGNSASTNDVSYIEAEGNVHIVTKNQKGFAEKAVYDVASGYVKLTGNNLKLESPSETLTARDSIEFWRDEQVAVAEGATKIVQRQNGRINTQINTLTADKVTAFFEENTEGNLAIDKVTADGSVQIITPEEQASGQRAVYDVSTGLARLTGRVTLVRAENQLKGDVAEVNLNTGVSRLLTQAGSESTGRVRGVFQPNNE